MVGIKRIFLYSILLMACGKSRESLVQYRDGRQLLTVNETDTEGNRITLPDVKLIAPDTIEIGEDFLAKIFLEGSDQKFVVAFAHCDSVASQLIDTATYRIDGCQAKLFEEDDTVQIAFRPQHEGNKTFGPVKIITKDSNKILRSIDYSFDYVVVQGDTL